MHYYTIDKEIRKSAYIILTIISLSLPTFINEFKNFIWSFQRFWFFDRALGQFLASYTLFWIGGLGNGFLNELIFQISMGNGMQKE